MSTARYIGHRRSVARMGAAADTRGMPTMNDEFPPRMDTRTAARFVGLSARTLEKRRLTCTADPPFLKLTSKRVVYDRDELLAWLESKRRASTSDPGPAPPTADAA